MGEQQHVKFPQEIIDEYAALGVDLPALFSAGHLGTRMGVQILEAAPEKVVGTMPVEGNTQPTACCTAAPPRCSRRPSARSAPCCTAAAPRSRSAST